MVRPVLAVGLLAACLFALTPVNSVEAAAPVDYQLIVACPAGNPLNSVGSDSFSTCPIKAVDEDDIMGSPALAVDPRDPDNMIIQSLHGTKNDNKASERSRGNLVFTSFITETHGANWFDRPFAPPSKIGRAFGEHPGVILDRHGHVYVGSLYAAESDAAPGGYKYTLVVQKFQDLRQANQRQGGSGEYGAQYLSTVYENQAIKQFYLVYNVATDTTLAVWIERPTLRPTEAATSPELPGLGLVKAPAPKPTPGASGSVIGIAWTTPQPKDPFHYHDEADLVGPCKTATNPVVHSGALFIGCVVDAKEGGYRFDANAPDGRIDLFRIPLQGDKPTYLGATPLRGGEPKMVISEAGRIAILTTSIGADGMPQMFGSYGVIQKDKVDWGATKSYGGKLYTPIPGRKAIESNIQNLVYREQTGAIHFIWKLRYAPPELGISIERPLGALQAQIVKRLVALSDDYGILANLEMHVGEVGNRTAFSSYRPGESEGVFNDLADGLVQMPPSHYQFGERDLGDDYQREFFAVGDYGIVDFAEVIEITTLRAPGAPAPPPPPPAIAAPSLSLNTTMVLSSVAGLTFAGVLAAKLALSRKTSPAAAAAKRGP